MTTEEEAMLKELQIPMTHISRNGVYYPIPVWMKEELELLEIIKNKKPRFEAIELGNYELYDLTIGGLTEEEFNKIKRWLDNEN